MDSASQDRIAVTKARVLFVDDHEVLARLSCEILELHGYIAIAANSTEHALVLCETISFDAIVCDQNHPGMSGDVFARTLRNRQYEKPIVCVTGNPQTIRDRPAFDVILTKTELFPQLVVVLDSLLAPESDSDAAAS